jgi:PhzF family phenazine biosynthesis protein
MELSIYQVDAFADHVFAGNPAAVCPLDEWINADLMQKIAMENNLSETAFFIKNGDDFDIRWFTPEVEIDLCGHATLASAHVIFSHLGYTGEDINFNYGGGLLSVQKEEDLLRMNFPATPAEECEAEDMLSEGLGAVPAEVYKSRDYLAVFNDEKEVRNLRPDFGLLNSLDAIGIIASAPGIESDFVSRFFAPGAGINEDPVTGSAHCTLIPYWAQRLKKTRMKAIQASNRGGLIHCEYLDDRVIIAGNAITYMQGSIQV